MSVCIYLAAQTVKRLSTMRETQVRSLGWEDPLEKEMAIHSRIAAAKSRQSCPTLCDPIDGSPLGSPIPGILQARTLEWVAISFSKLHKLAAYFCLFFIFCLPFSSSVT